MTVSELLLDSMLKDFCKVLLFINNQCIASGKGEKSILF